MRVAGTLAALLVLVGGTPLVWSRFVEGMIFQPTRGADPRPERLEIHAEDVFLETQDAVRIHAYWLPAAGAERALLFLHGNGGNASHRLPNAALLQRLGVHVLLLDYRGYGISEGKATEAGVYADARAGLAHLIEVRGIPDERIVVFGRSLGGAVAVDLAQDRVLAGIILESTFTSIPDVVDSIFGSAVASLAGRRFDSAAKIERVRAPLLFFHGDRDEVVAYPLGQRLFELAPEPKQFETLRGAGHNDTVQIGGRIYLERIQRFLDEVAPP